jgi:hypothetical protein
MVKGVDRRWKCRSINMIDHLSAARYALVFVFVLAFLLPYTLSAQDQSPILQRRITVHAEKVRMQTALSLMAKDGGFKLSYNAAVVPSDSLVTVHADNEKVDAVLKRTLPDGLSWKESGGHLIITGTRTRKQRFTATGSVFDAADGTPITSASVVEVKRNNAVITASNGGFEIALAGDLESSPLLFSRQGYRDTVVFVQRNADIGQVKLKPLEKLERIEPICLQDRCGVEDLGVARLLVPGLQRQQAANLDYTETRDWQISLIPSISTNGRLSGSMVNRASLNIIGGYARGVDGVEVGGGFNMISNDVRGLQIAGLSNLVGGHTRGVQIAGGINHTMLSSEGLQLAGLANVVWDTLAGVQVAGYINVVKREMTGTQVSGAANIALRDLNGVQVSGGVNIAHGVVEMAQVAGVLNFARGVRGGQVAAGANISLGDVGGGQVGLGANYARSVTGGQFSLGMNVVPGNVSGGQVGLGLNYAGSATGGQVSLGMNVVPGTVQAGQVGLGLNYAGHITGGQFALGANIVPGRADGGQVSLGLNYAGHVTGGQFTLGANIVPGIVEGGQVGVLNFGRKVLGGQLGILNLSDSLGGAAIGILSISLKGYHRFDVITGDIMPLSLQIRTGTRGFHNILGYSPPVTTDERWGFLYGIGTEPRFGKHVLMNIDITAEQVVEQREWVDAVNIVGRFSVSLGYMFADRIVISAGPLANLLGSDWRDAETGAHLSGLPPADLGMEWTSGDLRYSGWLGWRAALGVRF